MTTLVTTTFSLPSFPWYLSRQMKCRHVFVKFALSFLLMGLAFRLLFSDSTGSSTIVETHTTADKKFDDSPHTSAYSPANESQANQKEKKCDIFVGEWVQDPSGPVYTNESCYTIEDHQNCMRNGRPDSGYLNWRWNPQECEIARFDPVTFLHVMRNKSWAFIGDSISRNHAQSLLCMLSQVEQVIEVYHDSEYRSKRWHFPFHNFTLSVVWTPFLVKAHIFEDTNGVSTGEIQLHLDELDTLWTKQYTNFDYMVIAGGKWFLKTAIYHENHMVQGCHYCTGKNLTEIGYDYAYRKALQLVLNFVSGLEHKAVVFLRTTTPDHFENGEWFSGGTCNRRAPFRKDEIEMNDVDAIMRAIELEEFEKAQAIGLENGVVWKLLDTTRLSLLRPDGHPGPYRKFQPFADEKTTKVQNDCLHWCLPGPIDNWNDLVMEMLINEP